MVLRILAAVAAAVNITVLAVALVVQGLLFCVTLVHSAALVVQLLAQVDTPFTHLHLAEVIQHNGKYT
jgi:hypothetical protein